MEVADLAVEALALAIENAFATHMTGIVLQQLRASIWRLQLPMCETAITTLRHADRDQTAKSIRPLSFWPGLSCKSIALRIGAQGDAV